MNQNFTPEGFKRAMDATGNMSDEQLRSMGSMGGKRSSRLTKRSKYRSFDDEGSYEYDVEHGPPNPAKITLVVPTNVSERLPTRTGLPRRLQ